MTEPFAGGTAAAPFSMRAAASLTSAVVRAARQLLTDLERGRRIDAAVLRGAMEAAFGASDATGAWNLKIAYDACEVATVLVLRKFGSASHWIEADRESFATAWRAELADVPEFTESTIQIVAGLLLPIWKQLPNESTRVYRLQTDAGERVIGRKVSAAWVANALATEAPKLTPDALFAVLIEGRAVLDLAEGLQLRRARVMGTHRIELSGFTDAMRDRLKAYGLFHEIISWKLRMFVPSDATGVEILATVLDHFPIARVSEREAA
jgi:hypothetical protein